MFASKKYFFFKQQWKVKGQASAAFNLVSDPRTFARWFPLFKKVTVSSPSGSVCPGAKAECTVRAALPYTVKWRVTVTDVSPGELSTFVQVEPGPMTMGGTVRYTFKQENEWVRIENDQALMCDTSLPTPLHWALQRIFAWNHAWAMRRGEQGLSRVIRKPSVDGKMTTLAS